MRFLLNIAPTDDDFLLFQVFFGLYTEKGEQTIKKARLLVLCSIAVVALFCYSMSYSLIATLEFTVLYSIFAVLYLVFHKRLLKKAIMKGVKRMLEDDPNLFDRISVLEFYEDRLIERTPDKTIEETYSRIRAVYVVPDKAIYLMDGVNSGFIIPMAQLRMQADERSFVEFISTRCGSLELVDIK
jgi:hypothetical protein